MRLNNWDVIQPYIVFDACVLVFWNPGKDCGV